MRTLAIGDFFKKVPGGAARSRSGASRELLEHVRARGRVSAAHADHVRQFADVHVDLGKTAIVSATRRGTVETHDDP
jgi:hypothetical protein